MSRAMNQAAVTMNQLQHKLNLIGHNISNSNTHGYKSKEADFSSLLVQQINNLTPGEDEALRQTEDGIRVGSGARFGEIPRNLKQGAIQPAGGTDLLKSGALEQANVDLADEMTDMMKAQRSYQFTAKTISMANERQSLINQLR